MSKMNNKILINAVPIGKDLLKIGVREQQVVNIDDTLVYQHQHWANNCQWCYIKSFSGIDISCVFSDDRFSLIKWLGSFSLKLLILKIATNDLKVIQWNTGTVTFLRVFIKLWLFVSSIMVNYRLI